MRQLNKILLLCLILLFPMSLFAATVTVDVGDLRYYVDTSTKTATVKGLANTAATVIDIPGSIEYNGEQIRVTTIGWSAFDGCSGLTSVTIGNSVTSIGDYAFDGCSGLTSVTIGNSVTSIGYSAFRGCSGLTSVVIPNSVTSIGDYAFDGCSGLTSVTIGNSVTSIGYSAFRGCSGLMTVTIGNSVTTIGDYAFDSCPIREIYSHDLLLHKLRPILSTASLK